MSTENPRVEPTMTEVVSGIVTDFQTLVSQQLALLRAEIRTDWEKSKSALRPIAAGGLLAMVGLILLGFTAAFGLHWSVSPAGADMGRLPLWACFGVAAVAFLGVGTALIAVGVKAFQAFNPLPDKSADALTDNLKALVDQRGYVAR